jgi:hypothetical protein
MANEPGHVTTSNHTQRAPVFNNGERRLTPVDNVQPHCESHTTYPIRTWCNPPLSWSASNHDEACPCRIEESCPLRPQPKRHRYERRCIPPVPQTCNMRHTSRSLAFATHSDTGSTLAAARVPAIPFATGKSDSENTTHQSNNNTTPYPTIRSRPPPWPIKNSIKNRNKYYYGAHTSAGTTAKQRPPPWPIIPTPTTIFSISNSRPPPWPIIYCCQHNPVSSTPPAHPPPWPIIPHYSDQTIRNRQNTKRRLKAKSRRISDKISI